MSFAKLVQIHHDLNRMRGIDRDTFFGRLEILEWTCEEHHARLNEPWRKLGRWSNIVIPAAFQAALKTMREEYGFTKTELEELMNWVNGQGTPDQAVAGVLLKYFIQENY